MDYLMSIPADLFEIIGLIAGFSACFVVLIQVIKEYKTSDPSSLSNTFLIGWLLIYTFWLLYGIRFETKASGLPMPLPLVYKPPCAWLFFVKTGKSRHKHNFANPQWPV